MIYAGHFKLVKDYVIQLVIYSLETSYPTWKQRKWDAKKKKKDQNFSELLKMSN